MQKKVQYISFLSVFASLAVVFLHVNACFWNFSKDFYWITANLIESVFYFAVPIFFMITGATLLDYRDRYSTKVFVKKRIEKTVIPFVVWSIIGLLYMIILNPNSYQNITMKMLIEQFMNTQIISIYWFFIPLFSVYLSIPVLSLIPKIKRKNIFIYLIISCFITISLLPFFCMLFNIQYNFSLEIAVGGGYILYVILGYYLSHYDISKKTRYIIYFLSLIGLIIHAGGTYYLSMQNDSISTVFKGYLNVPCVLYSIGVFVFFKYNNLSLFHSKVASLVEKMTSYTFGIYLIHFYVIDLVVRILNINICSIVYRLVAPFIIFFASIIIIYIVRNIPLINKIFPK